MNKCCEHEWEEKREWMEEDGMVYIVFFKRCKKCDKREMFYIDENSIIPDG